MTFFARRYRTGCDDTSRWHNLDRTSEYFIRGSISDVRLMLGGFGALRGAVRGVMASESAMSGDASGSGIVTSITVSRAIPRSGISILGIMVDDPALLCFLPLQWSE